MKNLIKTLAIVLVLLPLDSGRSVAQIVDRIAVIVNGDVITLSEFEASFETFRQRLRQMELGPKREEIMEQSRRELLDRLINELLVEQEARRSGITVKEEEVTAVVRDQLARRNISPQELKEELEKEGLTLEEYRRGIKDQLIRMKLIRREVQARVIVTPEEIGRFYELHRHEYEGEEEVRIRQILIAVPREADEKVISRAKWEAQEIRNRISRGESFEALAARYAVGVAAATGGDLGFIGRGVMHKEVEEVAFKLPMHEVSDVIQSPVGFHLIRVVDRRGAGIKSLEEVREEIRARVEEQKLAKKFEEWLVNLRNKSYIEIRMKTR